MMISMWFVVLLFIMCMLFAFCFGFAVAMGIMQKAANQFKMGLLELVKKGLKIE